MTVNSLIYFNSIKVQLEQRYLVLERQKYLKFQFHKGTIRTRRFKI